jgi:hypothetical protein
MSLIRAGKDIGKGRVKPDRMAHIRSGKTLYSNCGKLMDSETSVKGCKLCDKCIDAAGRE